MSARGQGARQRLRAARRQGGPGLGTQIVRTLIQGELGGTIDWHTMMGSGTEVTIDIPLRSLTKS